MKTKTQTVIYLTNEEHSSLKKALEILDDFCSYVSSNELSSLQNAYENSPNHYVYHANNLLDARSFLDFLIEVAYLEED